MFNTKVSCLIIPNTDFPTPAFRSFSTTALYSIQNYWVSKGSAILVAGPTTMVHQTLRCWTNWLPVPKSLLARRLLFSTAMCLQETHTLLVAHRTTWLRTNWVGPPTWTLRRVCASSTISTRNKGTSRKNYPSEARLIDAWFNPNPGYCLKVPPTLWLCQERTRLVPTRWTLRRVSAPPSIGRRDKQQGGRIAHQKQGQWMCDDDDGHHLKSLLWYDLIKS